MVRHWPGREQRLAPGHLLPRDAPEVDRHPRHRVHLLALLSQLLQAADPDGDPVELELVAHREGAGCQGAGDDGAAALDGEGPVDPEPDAGVEVGRREPRRERGQCGAELGQALTRATRHRHGRYVAERGPGQLLAGLGDGARRGR